MEKLGDWWGGGGEEKFKYQLNISLVFTCFEAWSSDWPPVGYAAKLDLPASSSLVLGLSVFSTVCGLCSAGDLTQGFALQPSYILDLYLPEIYS